MYITVQPSKQKTIHSKPAADFYIKNQNIFLSHAGKFSSLLDLDPIENLPVRLVDILLGVLKGSMKAGNNLKAKTKLFNLLCTKISDNGWRSTGRNGLFFRHCI